MRYVSIFSGIEAASCAWGPLGWEPMAFAEVEPFPCRVLSERYPGVPNLGDVTQVDWKGFKHEHGPVDLLVGGSPCQSFSIAGGREGLAGESRLMWEWVRAVRDLAPEWCVWENVPGCLSSNGGDDFRCLLDALAGLGLGFAWRVLDAQFFGVAQRRRRVFLVGNASAGRAAAVLLELSCLQGGPRQGRAARKAVAERAGGCAGLPVGVPGPAGGAGAVPEVESLTGHVGQASRVYGASGASPSLSCPHGDGGSTHSPLVGTFVERMGREGGGKGVLFQPGVASTLDCGATQSVCAVAENQRSELSLSDAAGALSADGPGHQGGWVMGGTQAAASGSVRPTPGCPGDAPLAFLSHTCTGRPAVGEVSPTLFAGECGAQAPAVAFRAEAGASVRLVASEEAPTLAAQDGENYNPAAVLESMGVRRLTPLECERLQGFPDGWTRLPGATDRERYKALGNSMAVPVMRWIGERIEAVAGLEDE